MAASREILECWFEGWPIRKGYLVADGNKLADTGAHSYSTWARQPEAEPATTTPWPTCMWELELLMHAQVLKAFGGPDYLELRDIPKPEVRPGTVLIRIAAASVNPIDAKIMSGLPSRLPIGPDLPAVLGADLAGTVEEVGAGVLDFRSGDEVYGCAGGVKGLGGTLAEYIVADARLLAPKPSTLSLHEAAALPLVTITAWEGLERGEILASDHVLIHGGVGGVGHVAVQLAKAAGARVATTIASPEAAAVARRLGAEETINFHDESVTAYVDRLTAGRGFDLIFDTVGGDNLRASFEAAADEGRIATTNAIITQDLSPLHAKALSFYVIFMLLPLLHRGLGRDRYARILRSAAALVDAGKLGGLR